VKRFLKAVGLYLAIFVAAQLVSRLVLYVRVLDTSSIDVPIAMSTYLHEDRESMNPGSVANLKRVRIDSQEVIGRVFQEVRNTTLHGTKSASLFPRYPIFIMILQYDEGAENTLMYIEVEANKRLTVHRVKDAYYGYISQDTYDLLMEAYGAGGT
jgi:hypothetical protein